MASNWNIKNRISITEVHKNGQFYGQLIKRRRDAICKGCQVQINKGEEVLNVEKRNGFVDKFVGIFHIECFKKLTK